VLGPRHPDVARSLSALAAVYADRNQNEEAQTLLRRSLAILEDTLPASHPETMECRAQLATALRRNHQKASAAATMTSLRR
jgi:Tetratricopeptide repeat